MHNVGKLLRHQLVNLLMKNFQVVRLTNMRITQDECSSIKKVIYLFDKNAKIFLFGSRVDDTKRGGDIDLVILSKIISEDTRREIKLKLYEALGEQKIDLVITDDLNKPFIKIALEKGIPL